MKSFLTTLPPAMPPVQIDESESELEEEEGDGAQLLGPATTAPTLVR